MCIYVASRLSVHPHPEPEMENYEVILGYIYNLRESFKAAAEIWRKGHYPYVPGFDFLLYLELGEPYPKLPYGAGLEWVKRCDAILILNGLEDSPGVQKEFKEAKKRHKKIFYRTEDIPEANALW